MNEYGEPWSLEDAGRGDIYFIGRPAGGRPNGEGLFLAHHSGAGAAMLGKSSQELMARAARCVNALANVPDADVTRGAYGAATLQDLFAAKQELAALRAAGKARGALQPMDTAPRDGTQVLARRGKAFWLARYCADQHAWFSSAGAVFDSAVFDGWYDLSLFLSE